MAEPNQQNAPPVTKTMESIVALCRRRGFIFQSSEIYGGINGFWDYGPLGVELKRNLKEAWWHDIVRAPGRGPDGETLNIVPLDSTIISNPKIWVASGHAAGFNDPMVDCKECKARFRADHLIVVGWADWVAYLDRFTKTQGNDVDGYNDILAIQAEQKNWGDLSAGEQKKYRAILKIMEFKKAQLPPVYTKVVLASNEYEAFALAQLSAKEKKHLGAVEPIFAFEFAKYPGNRADLECPKCQAKNSLTEPRLFNLMFETFVGAVQSEDSKAWLRPETAQGIFANFRNVVDTSRVKVPFGIAQQGKAFRNEVTPRNFTFRSREFEQMEIEFFIRPDTAKEWYTFWRDSRHAWWKSIGLAGDNLQLREHDKDELSHYAKAGAGTSDIEYKFPFTAPGFGELEGVAHRTDFDLKAHAEHSGLGDKLKYFDQELQVKMQGEGVAKEEIAARSKYFPHVIEPSAGADRGTLALLCEAFTPDASRPSGLFMKFHPRMAPIKAGVFPLVNKDGMPEVAEKLYMELREKYAVQFDEKQTIGKRYARMDEAGTPFCFTIDGDTVKDQTVTVRHRDTQQQERVALDKVGAFLAEKIGE